MTSLEKIRAALQDMRPSRVAQATGLHVNTVIAIRDDAKADPKLSTLTALVDYLGLEGEE